MTAAKNYHVKDVARMTGVSIRALHYYDEIRLLSPARRTAAGYRLYDDDDLLRLQQVLIGRSLGLPLEEIRRSLDDPDFDYARSLRKQRALLLERLNETNDMIAAIDLTLNGLDGPRRNIDFAAIFDGFDPEEYSDETRERWGGTEAYTQSARRTKDYTEAQWREIKAELKGIWSDAAAVMQAATPPDSGPAIALAERHRQHVCRWFYDLSPEAHAQLAVMWESDERFCDNIDKHGEGLTAWLAVAVRAAADIE
ncbi:MAG: MerR family transcriptional regulator [Pseudomonadota bacterium]